MKMHIEKKYIRVPVNKNAVSKKLCFYENGELVMDFDCKLDFLSPVHIMYIDVSRYIGHELEYASIPQMDFELTQSDEKELDGLWSEQYRPLVHFTPEIGWLNDPNGLIKYDGEYHMFFQYNPCGTEWGNMHWGHATSKDLLHWKEKDIALFPDNMGTMYSGSAIEDAENVTGLKQGDKNPMLLFYTAAGDRGMLSGGKKRTQCLAYSNDGGRTFKKYEQNPVIPFVESYNRDPKVVWVEEIDAYVLVLYMADDRYGLFTSKNMLEWTLIQQLSIATESECPDMHSYTVNGKKYWVIMGASDKYVVGVFENGKFVRKTEDKRLSYCGSYAAQSFSGIDDGHVVRIAWDKLNMPCERAPMQMSIPTELVLESTEMGTYLKATPIREIEGLYTDTKSMENVTLDGELCVPLEAGAYDVHLVCDFESDMELEVFGYKLDVKKKENSIVKDKVKIPVSLDASLVDIRLIVDRCSVELFSDGGRFCATFLAVSDYNLPYLRIGAAERLTLKTLKYSKLKPIHTTEETV